MPFEYKAKLSLFENIPATMQKHCATAIQVSGMPAGSQYLIPFMSDFTNTRLVQFDQYGLQNSDINTCPSTASFYGAGVNVGFSEIDNEKSFIVFVEYGYIKDLTNISVFKSIGVNFEINPPSIVPPWEFDGGQLDPAEQGDYLYIKNITVLDNSNDGNISATNQRSVMQNLMPAILATITDTKLLRSSGYVDYGYFKGAKWGFVFNQLYRAPYNYEAASFAAMPASAPQLRIIRALGYNSSNQFVAGYTIFRNVSELQQSLNNWGFPYTFDYDSAYTKNMSDFPDYVPNGQKDNPTGGGDGDGDNSSDSISFPSPVDVFSPSALGGYNTLFMSPAEFEQFVKILWTPVIKSLGDALSVYFNQQPLTESVINMYYVPFDLKTQLDFSGTKTQQRADLTLAWSDTPFTARLLVSNVSRELMGGGELDVNEYYGSFLDYSPYTSVDIWLPYIGYKPLDVDKVMGKKITLKWFVDVVNGGLTCVILANGQPINTYTGQIGIDLAITGRDYATKIRRVVDNIGGLVGSVNKGVSAAASGIGAIAAGGAGAGAAGAGAEVSAAGGASAAGSILSSVGGSVLGGAGNVAQALMQQPTTTHYGTVDGENWLLMPQVAHLKITRTITATPADYIELRGYPASYTGTVGGFSGFLLADSLNMSAPAGATDDEIAAIRSAILNEGVII